MNETQTLGEHDMVVFCVRDSDMKSVEMDLVRVVSRRGGSGGCVWSRLPECRARHSRFMTGGGDAVDG